MSNNTTNMSLKKAVDSDNAEVYLITNLAGSLDTLDAHHHDGSTSGGKVVATDLSVSGGSAAQILQVNAGATAAAWVSLLSSLSNVLSGSVTMTSANTYYDGPSISIPGAGTYFVVGGVTITGNGVNANITAKLWDGTTPYSAPSVVTAAVGIYAILSVQALVVAAGAVTLKISAASDTAGCTIRAAAATNSPGNFASSLVAIRVA